MGGVGVGVVGMESRASDDLDADGEVNEEGGDDVVATMRIVEVLNSRVEGLAAALGTRGMTHGRTVKPSPRRQQVATRD